jgi:hypothetical protein
MHTTDKDAAYATWAPDETAASSLKPARKRILGHDHCVVQPTAAHIGDARPNHQLNLEASRFGREDEVVLPALPPGLGRGGCVGSAAWVPA